VQLDFQRRETLFARSVGLLGERDLFDLQLHDAPLDHVDLRRHRVDFDAQLARGFVDEVDRLVGQEPIGEVPVGKNCRADEGVVLDAHAVVHFVTLFQSAQDGDGVFHGGLAHVDLLEAPLECGVFLDVRAVLVERRGTDHSQLAAREHRLHHVAGIHRAVCRAGADEIMDLIDERDDLAARVGHFFQDGLQALFELAAIFRTGHHRGEVERHETLGLQAFRHVARGDPLGEPLDDCGLADAGFADEDRIVLRAPRQHLHHAPNFFVAADDRVDFPVAGARREIDAVLRERLKLILGVLRRDTVRSAHLAKCGEHPIASHADDVMHRHREQFHREEVVAEFLLQLCGIGERVRQFAVESRLRPAFCARQLGER